MLRSICAALAAVLAAAGLAAAAEGEFKHKEYKHEHWHFDGVFGGFEQETLQRGYQVYREICSGCHSMELLSFRNLSQKGGPFFLESCPEGAPDNIDCSNPNDNPIVKAIAAEYEITDGVDDYGDPVSRPRTPADRFPSPFANEQQARAANGGAYPPDMSLLVKARHHGPDYIYSLLTGYEEEPPEDFEVQPGLYYNPYFETGALAMAQPLYDGMIDYADMDESQETVEQYSKDVVEFLTWAAEPKLQVRKQMGFMVVAYLFLFTVILYLSYKKIWANVEH
ncbi:MAG: cytochrome c1 [Pseudomonadota bacterium]